MPIAGWLILSGEGKSVPFFGLTLPHLIAPNGALAEQMEEWHELGGTRQGRTSRDPPNREKSPR